MKILFLTAHYPGFGGIEKVTHYIADAFSRAGHEVSILAGRNLIPADKREADPTRGHIATHYLPDEADMLAPANAAFLNDFLFGRTHDVVIYQDSYVPDLFSLIDPTRLAARTFRFIVVEHNMPRCHMLTWREFAASHSLANPRNWLRLALYPLLRARTAPREAARHRALVGAADRYIVLAEAYIGELLGIVGEEHAAKVSAIPNPTTIDIPSTLPEKKKQCLFVARLERNKGVDILVSIWKKFHALHPDWELLIVGTGRYTGYLQYLIHSGRLPSARLEGVHHDMRPYYASASMLLLTSRIEGWVLVLAEAMAYGTTPVAFNSYGALTETMTDGREGAVIPAFRIDRYVQAMSHLATHTPTTMRQAAHLRAQSLHIERIMPMWEEVIRKE